jgi:4-hydroxybenzoate polyprenyltransferase
MYLLGPYLLGLTAAGERLTILHIAIDLVFALYFTLPANLLVYGVNDICDYDTDRANPKKQLYEALVLPSERRPLVRLILIVSVPFVIAACLYASTSARVWLTVFVLLSVFYSLPPIRAKVRPFVDSAFNILYAIPGFFGWALAGGGTPSINVVVASLAWTMAMHAYSAAPDIESDRLAGLSTIATVLGDKATIVFCLVLYSVASVLAAHYFGLLAIAVGSVYILLMAISLQQNKSDELTTIYRLFPAINAAVGFILFVALFLQKRF